MKSSASLPLLLPLLFLTILSTAFADEVYGKIVSCSGWSLNRLPILKEFLKGGNGAAIYKNVDIEFERGRKAILTIHEDDEDGEIIDTIILSEYETEKEMHDLFKKFGFQELTPEEIEAKREAEEERIREDRRVRQEEYLKLQKEYREQNENMNEEEKISEVESEQADNTNMLSKLDKVNQLLNENQSSIEVVLNDKKRYLNMLDTVEDENMHENLKLQLLKAERKIEQLEEESTKLKKKYAQIAAMKGDEL